MDDERITALEHALLTARTLAAGYSAVLSMLTHDFDPMHTTDRCKQCGHPHYCDHHQTPGVIEHAVTGGR